MGMKKYVFTLDLKDDPQLIATYLAHHSKVWPEVIKHIKLTGIIDMEIYHVANRLMMIIKTEDHFSFEKKQKLDAANSKIDEWETLMDQYQQRLPFAKSAEKWVKMSKIFSLQKT